MAASASISVISVRSTWGSGNKIALCSVGREPHASACCRLQEPHRHDGTMYTNFNIMKVTINNSRLEFSYKLLFKSRLFRCYHISETKRQYKYMFTSNL
jgi:hypothetical protein